MSTSQRQLAAITAAIILIAACGPADQNAAPPAGNAMAAHTSLTRVEAPAHVTQPTPENAARAEAPEAHDLARLLQQFNAMTDLQQESWNHENEWKLLVTGSGEVSEVNKVNLFSEIKSADYELTCELPGGDRAVLFLDEARRDYVLELNVGDAVTFTGQLKSVTDWGFWRTGYVMVH